MILSRSVILRMRIDSDKSYRENHSRHFVFRTFFFENRAFMIECEKYCRAGQTIDENVAHAHNMMDN